MPDGNQDSLAMVVGVILAKIITYAILICQTALFYWIGCKAMDVPFEWRHCLALMLGLSVMRSWIKGSIHFYNQNPK